eukprot:TRINITY_DN55500_c0_g1_i1.p1 TRINITY_DN55500_c0_g1~~TRINITY_DN55500_c0_g1_i1.p1  ORF type:complete len:500 (+),score=85.35 TRINITY_DN55500_c0_g1_i1:32-1531(+)
MAAELSPRPEHHLSPRPCKITYIDLRTPKPPITQPPQALGPPTPTTAGIPISPASSDNSGSQAHEALSPAFCYHPEEKRLSETPLSASVPTPRPSQMETDVETDRQEWERQLAVEQSEKTQALAAREQAVSEREASVAERERLLLFQIAELQEKEKFLKQRELTHRVCEVQTEAEAPHPTQISTELLLRYQPRYGVGELIESLNKAEEAKKNLQHFLSDCTIFSDVAQAVNGVFTRAKKEPLLQERLLEAQQRFAAVQAIRSSRPNPGQAKDQQFQAALDGLEDVIRFLAETYSTAPTTSEPAQPDNSIDSFSPQLEACKLRVNALRVASRVAVDNLEQAISQARRVGHAVEAADEDAATIRSKLLRLLNVVYREYAPLCNTYVRMKEVVVRRNERRVSHLRKLVEGMVEVDPSAGPISEEMQTTVGMLEDQQKHLRKYFEQKARVSGFVEKLLETSLNGREREEDEEIEQLAKRPRQDNSPEEKPTSLLGRVFNFVWG